MSCLSQAEGELHSFFIICVKVFMIKKKSCKVYILYPDKMQCALASLTFLDLSKELYSLTVSIYCKKKKKKKKKKTDTIKEDRKNQTGNKIINLQFFGPKLKRLIKHSSIL